MSESEPTGQKQNTKFKPGQSGNPAGRPKGARNKLGEDFVRAMQEDFEQHGVAAISTVRTERPHEYLKVIASLLPKDVNVNHDVSDAFMRAWTAISDSAERGNVGPGVEREREQSPSIHH